MGFFNFFSSRKETPKQPLQSKALFQLDLFTNLSQTQKFAMVTMLASLAAAPTNAERTAMAQRMMFTDAEMMGITQNMMLNYMQTHTKSNSHSVISTLRTITDTNIQKLIINRLTQEKYDELYNLILNNSIKGISKSAFVIIPIIWIGSSTFSFL